MGHRPSGDSRPFAHNFKALAAFERRAAKDVLNMQHAFMSDVRADMKEAHSLAPAICFVLVIFACMYCVSIDGTHVIILDLFHKLTGYAFESSIKGRSGAAPRND